MQKQVAILLVIIMMLVAETTKQKGAQKPEDLQILERRVLVKGSSEPISGVSVAPN